MKPLAIILVGYLCMASPVRGADQAPPCCPPPATITVSGSVTEEFPPDTAILTLAVETNKPTAQEAAQENAGKSGQVVTAMKSLINRDGDDAVTTSAYSVQPVYEFDDKLKKNRVVGYRTYNQVTVKTVKIDTIGVMIDQALRNGANNVTDVRFALKDNRKPCAGLLTKSSQRARRDADTVAKALGVRIDGIRHVAPSCSGDQRSLPVYRSMGVSKMMDNAETVTPIEAGTLALTGQVQVEFILVK